MSSQACRLDCLGVRSIGVDSLPDQPLRRLLEMEPEARVQVRKLPRHHGVEKAARRPDLIVVEPLPRIAEWPNAITPAQGDEQSDRPLVRQAELHLDGRIVVAGLELGFQPLCCGFGGITLSRKGRAEIQRLHLL